MRVSNNRVTPSSMQTALERKHSRAAGSKGAFLETLRQAESLSPNMQSKGSVHGKRQTRMALSENSTAPWTLKPRSQVDPGIDERCGFVVAPQSRTVVTVIPEDRMKHNLFTSIDSAVLVDKVA